MATALIRPVAGEPPSAEGAAKTKKKKKKKKRFSFKFPGGGRGKLGVWDEQIQITI